MESHKDMTKPLLGEKRVLARFLALVSISVILCCSVACVASLGTSEALQQNGDRPQETPVPFHPSEGNKGKPCAAKVFSDVGQADDYNPFCYEVQRRLVKGAHDGNLEEMRAALRDGANVDGSVYNFYYAPLHTAAEAGQSDAARLLLDNRATVNQGDFINGTPLIVAAIGGHKKIVQILLERGADVCVKADGGTAREFAEKNGHKEIAELLKAAESESCK